MHQAQDTFNGFLDDGITPFHINKGAYLPDNHELVKRDQDPAKGAGNLFKRVFIEDEGDAPKPRRGRPPKAAAEVPAGNGDA